MRLILLFTILLILQLTLADTYYNAETCGISTTNTARRRRSMRYKREIKKEDTEDDDDVEEEEEEEETEEEETENPFGNSTTPEPYGNYDHEEEGRGEEAPDESMTEKVMGGTDAKLGELPWAVMLRIPLGPTKKKYSVCGGTLISNRHVITAAHCFKIGDVGGNGCMEADMMSDQEIVDKTQVFVGGICRKLRPKEKGTECPENERGEERRIRRVAFKRPFFDDKCSKSMWDVTLLELDFEIDGPHACLPHLHNMDQFNVMHMSMISFGFGANPLEGTKLSRRLQKVDLGTALDPDDCRRLWRLPFNNFICTRESTTKNVCVGDSGGGILAKYNNRYFIVGIISFGSSCDDTVNNGRVQNAQVNMDINLYTATIDKYIEKQTPNYHDLWKDPK